MKVGNGLRKVFATIAAFASLGFATQSAGVGQSTSKTITSNKEAVRDHSRKNLPVAIKNKMGGFSGESSKRHTWPMFRNQRQYRKLVRQNPHFRRSKKCKIKTK